MKYLTGYLFPIATENKLQIHNSSRKSKIQSARAICSYYIKAYKIHDTNLNVQI